METKIYWESPIHLTRDIGIYFKKLIVWLWRFVKSKISGQPGRLETQVRVAVHIQGRLAGKISSPFYLGLQLIRWGPPTRWRAICFTQSLLIQMLISSVNTSTGTSKIVVWPTIWVLWPSQIGTKLPITPSEPCSCQKVKPDGPGWEREEEQALMGILQHQHCLSLTQSSWEHYRWPKALLVHGMRVMVLGPGAKYIHCPGHSPPVTRSPTGTADRAAWRGECDQCWTFGDPSPEPQQHPRSIWKVLCVQGVHSVCVTVYRSLTKTGAPSCSGRWRSAGNGWWWWLHNAVSALNAT